MNYLAVISLGFFVHYVGRLLIQNWGNLPKSISYSVKKYGWLKFLLFGWGVGVPMLCYDAVGYTVTDVEQVILAMMGICLMLLSVTVNVWWGRTTKLAHFIFSGLLFALGYLFVYLHFSDYYTVSIFALISTLMIIFKNKNILLWVEIIGAIPLFYWLNQII